MSAPSIKFGAVQAITEWLRIAEETRLVAEAEYNFSERCFRTPTTLFVTTANWALSYDV